MLFFLVKSRNLIILRENTSITKPLQINFICEENLNVKWTLYVHSAILLLFFRGYY